MNQLVFIHGGETFDTYEDYVVALRVWTYEPDKEIRKRWKHGLPECLGNEWEVFMPAMPSKYNAKFLEWSIWFEKVIPYLKDDVIFVGHSLGGIFLAKYLNTHALPIKISATFLVAAPFDTEDTDYSLADFTLPTSLDGLSATAGALFIYHSVDDLIVPFGASEKYRALLPESTVRVFDDKGHFMQETFPELIDDIKKLRA